MVLDIRPNLSTCVVLRDMKALNTDVPNFLEEKDSQFTGLGGTRDTVSHSLRAQVLVLL